MYIRYMDGVSLTCLKRVYNQPITKIFNAIKEYQLRSERVPAKTGRSRNRQAKVLSKPQLEPSREARVPKKADKKNQPPKDN